MTGIRWMRTPYNPDSWCYLNELLPYQFLKRLLTKVESRDYFFVAFFTYFFQNVIAEIENCKTEVSIITSN